MLSRTGKREVLSTLEGRWAVSGDARYSLLPWKSCAAVRDQLLSRARRFGKIGKTVPLFAHPLSIQISGAGPSPQVTAMGYGSSPF